MSSIPLCIYVPHLLYPFISQFTSMLLPYLSYCKQCCNEHWCTCVFQFQFPQGKCLEVVLLGHMVVLFLVFFKGNSVLSSIMTVSVYIPPEVQEGSLFSTLSPALVCGFFDDGHSDKCEVIVHCSFDLHFSKATLSSFSCAYWPSVCFLWRNVCLGLLLNFYLGCFVLILSCMSFLFILEANACQLYHLQIFTPCPYVVF